MSAIVRNCESSFQQLKPFASIDEGRAVLATDHVAENARLDALVKCPDDAFRAATLGDFLARPDALFWKCVDPDDPQNFFYQGLGLFAKTAVRQKPAAETGGPATHESFPSKDIWKDEDVNWSSFAIPGLAKFYRSGVAVYDWNRGVTLEEAMKRNDDFLWAAGAPKPKRPAPKKEGGGDSDPDRPNKFGNVFAYSRMERGADGNSLEFKNVRFLRSMHEKTPKGAVLAGVTLTSMDGTLRVPDILDASVVYDYPL